MILCVQLPRKKIKNWQNGGDLKKSEIWPKILVVCCFDKNAFKDKLLESIELSGYSLEGCSSKNIWNMQKIKIVFSKFLCSLTKAYIIYTKIIGFV